MGISYGRSQGRESLAREVCVGADRSKAAPEYYDTTNMAKNVGSHSANFNLEVHPIPGLGLRKIRGENLDNLVYTNFMDSEEMRPEKIGEKEDRSIAENQGDNLEKNKMVGIDVLTTYLGSIEGPIENNPPNEEVLVKLIEKAEDNGPTPRPNRLKSWKRRAWIMGKDGGDLHGPNKTKNRVMIDDDEADTRKRICLHDSDSDVPVIDVVLAEAVRKPRQKL